MFSFKDFKYENVVFQDSTRNGGVYLTDEGIQAAQKFENGQLYDMQRIIHDKGPMGLMDNKYSKIRDNAVAFVTSSLERVDPMIYKAITNFWKQQVPIKFGGGWVDFVAFMNVTFSETDENGWISQDGNSFGTVSYEMKKAQGQVRTWGKMLKLSYIDMQRQSLMVSRVSEMLNEGIVLSYNKMLDRCALLGFEDLDSKPGMINSTDIFRYIVDDGASGDENIESKTTDEILADINKMMFEQWEEVEYVDQYMADTVLFSPRVYTYLATQRVTPDGASDKTILKYLQDNNIGTIRGKSIKFDLNPFLIGIGEGDRDRTVVYKNDMSCVRINVPVNLTRTFTTQSAEQFATLTPYVARISEVEFVRPETMVYADGL